MNTAKQQRLRNESDAFPLLGLAAIGKIQARVQMQQQQQQQRGSRISFGNPGGQQLMSPQIMSPMGRSSRQFGDDDIRQLPYPMPIDVSLDHDSIGRRQNALQVLDRESLMFLCQQ